MRSTTAPVRRRLAAGLAAILVLATTSCIDPPPPPVEPDLSELESRLHVVVEDAAAAGVTLSVTVEDLSGTYGDAIVRAGGNETVKAASIIKLPLLALLMDRVDEGSLDMDTVITIPAGDPNIVGGSGTLRTRTFPVDITIEELMELMVVVSDNTATNVLIDVAGGFDEVNDYIDGLGFDTLYLGRKMIQPAVPPLQENYIDADEVTELLQMIWDGEILSRASSDHIIGIMKAQLVNTKYGAVIPREFLANKTGELADVSHDSGFILLEGREVAMATTTAFTGMPRSVADAFVQETARITFEFLQEPVPGT